MTQLLASVPVETQQELLDGLLRKGCGHRLWVEGGKRPGGRALGGDQRQARLTWVDTGEVVEGWIYSMPPDPIAAKIYLEHKDGRPGVREVKQIETAIYLVHRVPGRRTHLPKPEEEATLEPPADEPVVDDPVAAMGLGLASVMPPEPEDTDVLEG